MRHRDGGRAVALSCALMPHRSDAGGDRPDAPRILVVDDEETIRESLVSILDGHGYEAVGASDGRDALAKLRASPERWGMILLDLTMPNMDGRQFRREQRRDPALARIPVAILSAFRDVEAHAADLGAASYLTKPLSLPALLELLRQRVPRRAAR
jgi:CheY-like chemotaxis protein